MTVDDFIACLPNPQVYSGLEINALRRPFSRGELNVCLVFPDKYEIGMSHQGLKILYHLLNEIPGVHAQRAFLPDRQAVEIFMDRRRPLFSLEEKTPLNCFDLIGISLLSELNFTNIPLLLALSQIPFFSAERDERHPLVAVGGISAANPEPLRKFIDIFALGDGEILAPRLMSIVAKARKQGWSRKKILQEMDGQPGLYIPALHPVRLKGRFLRNDLPQEKIKKKTIEKISPGANRHKEIVALGNTVFNRLAVEIARGCPQNCRFCQAKSFYAPFRPQPLSDLLGYIKKALLSTGYENCSLTSLSSGDYPDLKNLLRSIPDCIPDGVSLSLPSLRPAAMSTDLLAAIAAVRHTGLTIVPEAGSERLRCIINKDVTDEEVLAGIKLAGEHRWQRIKLYFMIGLPHENQDDLDKMIVLIEKLLRAPTRKMNYHLSFSSFVPKPHTPFQWAARESLEGVVAKINFLKNRLKRHRQLDLDFHSALKSHVETVLSRGDERVGEWILEAFRRGEIFTAWDAEFNFSNWRKVFGDNREDVFLEEIPLHQELPWDFIALNYKRKHLLSEWQKAGAGITTPPCTPENCSLCRGCFFPMKPAETRAIVSVPSRQEKKTGEYRRARLFYKKEGPFRYLSHLTIIQLLERLIRKTGLSCQMTDGYHPRMKMVFLPPLPVLATSSCEIVEFFPADQRSAEQILQLFRQADYCLEFTDFVFCPEKKRLSADLHTISYEYKRKISPDLQKKIKALLGTEDSMVETALGISLVIDYGKGGQERFSRIYKTLDPKRKSTMYLERKKVSFHGDLRD